MVAADRFCVVRRGCPRLVYVWSVMMDALHRILSGSPLGRKQLALAGTFVLFWFVIDFVQWVDWLHDKIKPPMTTMCLPLELMPPSRALMMPSLPAIPPHIDNLPFRIDRDQ